MVFAVYVSRATASKSCTDMRLYNGGLVSYEGS